MAKIHHLTESLEKEHQGQARSNRFYIEMLHATNIERIGYHTAPHKALQQHDIDLYATIGGRKIAISEKDRNREFDDVLIEFYSLYPHTKGWMDNSEADMMAYFTPSKVSWINKRQLVSFYNNHLLPLPVESHFEKLKATQSYRTKATFEILGREETIGIIAAYNSRYVTMSITVSYALLKRAGVEFTIFSFV